MTKLCATAVCQKSGLQLQSADLLPPVLVKWDHFIMNQIGRSFAVPGGLALVQDFLEALQQRSLLFSRPFNCIGPRDFIGQAVLESRCKGDANTDKSRRHQNAQTKSQRHERRPPLWLDRDRHDPANHECPGSKAGAKRTAISRLQKSAAIGSPRIPSGPPGQAERARRNWRGGRLHRDNETGVTLHSGAGGAIDAPVRRPAPARCRLLT